MRKGRYGRFIKCAITLVDFIILNIVFFSFGMIFPDHADFNNVKVWIILNFSYFVSVFLYSNIHEQRFISADQVLVAEFRMLILNVALFLSILAIVEDYDLPLEIIGLFYLVFFTLLGLWWLTSRRAVKMFRAHGFNFKRVIIIGRGRMGLNLLDEMLSDAGYGYRILGFFDDEKGSENLSDYKGGINEVEQFVKDNLVDEMYCTIPGDANDLTEKLIKISENNAVDFYYVPQVSSRLMRQFELHNIGNLPALSLRPNPLNKTWNKIIKRGFDLLVSSTFLIISPIIFLPVAIGIKLSSPGPIFFKQKRTGYRGQEFLCYKFRTMKVNKQSDTMQTTKHDPRKTRFGTFLRKTSIDELPQFYNVWKGEMSIVGPRPHMLKHTKDYSALVNKYMLRHTVKPGITGWAQVSGYRGETKELWQMEKRVECDVWYAENWNFMLDIKIIFKTVVNAICGEKNAF